jgi:hypothetical protein
LPGDFFVRRIEIVGTRDVSRQPMAWAIIAELDRCAVLAARWAGRVYERFSLYPVR